MKYQLSEPKPRRSIEDYIKEKTIYTEGSVWVAENKTVEIVKRHRHHFDCIVQENGKTYNKDIKRDTFSFWKRKHKAKKVN